MEYNSKSCNRHDFDLSPDIHCCQEARHGYEHKWMEIVDDIARQSPGCTWSTMVNYQSTLLLSSEVDVDLTCVKKCVYMSCVPKNCMYAYIYIVTYSYSIHVHMLIHDSYKKLELHNSHQDSRSSSFLRISEKLPIWQGCKHLSNNQLRTTWNGSNLSLTSDKAVAAVACCQCRCWMLFLESSISKGST